MPRSCCPHCKEVLPVAAWLKKIWQCRYCGGLSAIPETLLMRWLLRCLGVLCPATVLAWLRFGWGAGLAVALVILSAAAVWMLRLPFHPAAAPPPPRHSPEEF